MVRAWRGLVLGCVVWCGLVALCGAAPVWLLGAVALAGAALVSRDLQLLASSPGPVQARWLRLPRLSLLGVALPPLRPALASACACASRGPASGLGVAPPGVVASSLERRFVWSWYSHYVSKEIAFPFACKELLDQIVSKVFQISYGVDTVNLMSDFLLILLKHCKEYKRSVKLKMKNAERQNVEDFYRNSHPTSLRMSADSAFVRSKSTQSHCLALIESVLKELLPWELWGTPHALLLSSILAKQLEVFISTGLSDPVWLKTKILYLVSKKDSPVILKTSDATAPPSTELKVPNVEDVESEIAPILFDGPVENIGVQIPSLHFKSPSEDLVKDDKMTDISITSIESALGNMISNSTAPILQRAEMDGSPIRNALQSKSKSDAKRNAEISNEKSQPIEFVNDLSKSENYGTVHKAKQSTPVKIYDKIIEGSIKTWSDDNDLECVSLGHDLLATIDKEVDFESRLGRLWEADGTESAEVWSPSAPSTGSSAKTSHALWFGEDDNLDVDSTEDSPPKNMVQNNISSFNSNFNISKPLSLHNMKELQNISKNTVTHAKHKIGDLQDEAAGVMEGILDLGMAGLRKGLRLTRLQDSPQDKVNLPAIVKGAESTIASTIDKVLSTSRKNSQSEEIPFKNDCTKLTEKELVEKSINNGSSILIKQNRVTSQDSTMDSLSKSPEIGMDPKVDSLSVPLISDPLDSDSPDYEYEEPADFASTIAKLRCLLQQKTGDTTPVCSEQDDIFPSIKMDSGAEYPLNNIKKKSEETTSLSSFDSETGFTVFNTNFPELSEAEEALHHKSGPSSIFGSNSSIPQNNINNIQRLDKLFTRTVTGVFNTIKTAVGGDSSSDVVSGQADSLGLAERQRAKEEYKEEWIYIESDADLSVAISRMLMERRNFCVVEAAQDSLEILDGSKTPTDRHNVSKRTIVTDDFEESELISSCPLWHMCTEIVALTLEGPLQKEVVVKSISVAVADIMESKLEDHLNKFTEWLRVIITQSFQELSKGIDDTYIKSEKSKDSDPVTKTEVQNEPLLEIDPQSICDAIMEYIPDVIVTILGKEGINEALKFIILSIENQSINKDVIFNLLDIFAAYFLRACSRHQQVMTPPPSA